MIVVATSNGKVGIGKAIDVMREGGSALDAVEEASRLVESDPDEHYVGLGSIANVLGQVELDASIMDGRTLACGAVGGVRNYEHPISIARRVMQELPHVLMVADGAERFAQEMGFPKCDLLTEAAQRMWEEHIQQALPQELRAELLQGRRVCEAARLATDPTPRQKYGTVVFIARDARGDIACGVSTSGYPWKYPGRVGDSAVIGAGNYADNRYGAAGCVGLGEMSIRAGTARSLVLYLAGGAPLEEAGRRAAEDLKSLAPPYLSSLNIIALDKEGRHGGFTNNEGGGAYIFVTNEMSEPESRPSVVVPGAGTVWSRP